MRIARVFVLGLVLLAGFTMWRNQLWLVQKPGVAPQPLALAAPARRREVAFDVALPAIPEGLARVRSHGAVTVVHYWAPWERDGRAQSAALDSLRKLPDAAGAHVALVTFDPFPSVARYVRRHKLGLPVLLDHQRALVSVLPCPSLPYTYVLDASGRVVVEQAGEVDWLSPETRRVLQGVLTAPAPPPGAPPADATSGS